MRPQSHQVICTVNRIDGFVDGVFPPGQLTRGIDVVGLDVGSEVELGLGVELDHCVGEIVRVGAQGDAAFEHCFVEGAEDLLQGVEAGEIDKDQGTVSQEAGVEGLAADVGGRVARADKLYPFKRDPLPVGASGVGKTTLSRFVSWLNNISVFQIKAGRNYSLTDFDEDLRNVMKRAGVKQEKICFIFDESNCLSPAFLEKMNALLASG